MFESIESLRKIFSDPPNSYRHLAIIHAFLPGHRYSFQPDTPGCTDILPADMRQTLSQRLAELASWGFGGVVANVVPPNYLENEQQWAVFLAGVEEAAKLGMRMWIYDEDGYPSGAAGGIVLRDHPEYEAQGLARLSGTFDAGRVELRPPQGWLGAVRAEAVYEGQDQPVDVTEHVASDGWLRFDAPEKCMVSRFDARRAFEGTHATQNVFAIRRYVNLLQREAVDYFFHVTAEQYLDRLGENARHVEAVFTDEPSFMTAYFPDLPESIAKVTVQDEPEKPFDRLPMVVWEASLPERFRERWGYDLVPDISRLFEGSDPRDMRVRHDFGQLISEIYAEAFFESQQSKLGPRGIEFSGHVLAEENLAHHAASQGNLMADLKHMGIPGIDSLGSIAEENMDSMHLLACKYGSSAAHAARRTQVMSESSDWMQRVHEGGTDLRQRRGAMAVQMALGVTTITSYYPSEGTDPVGRRALLDFLARIATVLRNSTHVCDVAVLYPIRTAWACYKPFDRVMPFELLDEPLKSMDGELHRIARSILRTGLDFDFIDTRDLVGADITGGKLGVADESYSVLVVPPGAVMCPNDIERTEEFAASGGFVLAFEPCSEFALPEIVSPPDGRDTGPGRSPAQVIGELASKWPERVKRCSLGSNWPAIIKGVSDGEVRIDLDGDYLIARQSVAGDTRFVLIANGAKEDARARVEFPAGRLLELWNLETGEVSSLASNTCDLNIEGYGAVVIVG